MKGLRAMRLTRRIEVGGALALLVCLHVAVLGADVVAPYPAAEQAREIPFAPPARVRFVDAQGTIHLRPFIYATVPDPDDPDVYREDTSRRHPIVFFTGNGRLFGVEPPGRIALLGTDGYGRDVFSRVVYGGRLSLLAGIAAAALSLALGLLLGTVAGFYGRWVDAAVMRVGDLFLAVPWLYLLFAVRAALPLHIDTSTTFLLLIGVVGALGWARPARLVRGIVLSARERAYVTAARGFGAAPPYLLWRHLVPQTYGVLLVQAGILIPQYMLVEVTLSFLGLGAGEPEPSWGTMLAALQQYHVLTSYWWMFAPAVAMTLVALAYHLCASTMHERVRSVAP